MSFVLGITRSIGFTAVFAIGAYFIIQRQWRNLVLFAGAFIIVMAAFQGLKYVLWGDAGMQFSEQGSRLMYKDFYTPALGKEDLGGFIKRLTGNSNYYFSFIFYTLIGLRKMRDTNELFPLLTGITCIMLLLSVILVFRKNRYLLFTGIWVLCFPPCHLYYFTDFLGAIETDHSVFSVSPADADRFIL